MQRPCRLVFVLLSQIWSLILSVACKYTMSWTHGFLLSQAQIVLFSSTLIKLLLLSQSRMSCSISIFSDLREIHLLLPIDEDFDSNWIWSACIKYFPHSEMTKSINFVTVAPIKIHSNTSIWRSPSAKKLTPSLVDYLLYAHGERRPRARRTHTRARRAPVCVRVGTGAPDACALVTCVLYSTATYTSPV